MSLGVADWPTFGEPLIPAAVENLRLRVAIIAQRPPETGGLEAAKAIVGDHQSIVADT